MYGIFTFVMGLFVGSFLNVCIYRIPRHESVVFPPSHCPNCKKQLRPWDLVPILSYVFNKGRCRYCKFRISLLYPFGELLTGLIYLLVYVEFGLTLKGCIFLLFSSTLIVIAGIDARHRIIPDTISIPGMITGLSLAFFVKHISFLEALGGLFIGGGLFLLIAVITRGGMGGGDIKMMAFVGSFLGIKGTLLAVFLGSVFGSVYGIYLMAFKNAHRKTAIPYGPFLALGAYLVTLYGDEIISFYIQWLLR